MKPIFWAAILAFAFYPLHTFFRKKIPGSDTLTALLTTFLIILTVIPPVIFLILNLTGQAIELYQSATLYIRDGNIERLIDQVRSLSFIQKIEARAILWEPLKENATAMILNASKATANFAIAQAGVITKNLFFLSLNALLAFCLIFVFLKDGPKIYNFIYQIAPFEEENKRLIFGKIDETFSAVIRGQILTSIIQSVTAGFVFRFLGLPAPIFFAGATFMATLIPFLGAVSVWVPLTLYLFAVQLYPKALILLVCGIFISTIDNFTKPALIGEKMKLPYFLLFFGILGGISLYGLMGIFLGPLILSLFFALITIYREKFL